MSPSKVRSDNFVRVADCLYRYVPNGRYYGIYRRNGKLTKKKIEADTLAEAKRLLRDELEKIERVDPGAGRMTLAALCDEYLEGLKQAPKTTEQKLQIAKRIKEEWPHPSRAECQVRTIKPTDVRKWLASYEFGPATYNAHLWFVRAVFDHAIENRRLAENPAASIKGRKREKPLRRTPSFEEFHAIVDSIRSQKRNARAKASADFVEFMGLAGVGNAETRNLTWGDVDFQGGKITLFRQKTKTGYQIPIFPQLSEFLKRLKGPEDHPPGKAVFEIRDAKKALSAACVRLGYSHFDHRSLRRMFVTRALQKGVDVKTVALWQGHRDGGRLILSTYSHVIDTHSNQMAKLMALDTPD